MKRTVKMLISLSLAVVLSVIPVLSGYASPSTLPYNYSGTVNYLVDIRKPETLVSTTTNRNCVISAVAVKGTKITLYSYNYATGAYEVLKNAWGGQLESYVGASGLYVQQITLKDGQNSIMVVGQTSANTREVVKLEISLLNSGYMNNVNDNFKSGVGVVDIFNH